jgi:ABC-type Mn2+/Zn2+ transport system ATPase subunit
MGVAGLGSTPYRRLSEGQKQRVLFARLSVSRADLAVLDEPTSAMDSVAEGEAFALLDGLRRKCGLSIVVVSHYLGMVKRYADNAVLLDRDSQHIVVGAPEQVFQHKAFQARFSERPPPALEHA